MKDGLQDIHRQLFQKAIRELKSTFGFSVLQICKVLGVKKRTLFRMMAGTSDVQIDHVSGAQSACLACYILKLEKKWSPQP
jgi:hypothetical protein